MENLVNQGWVKLWRELLSKSIWTHSSPQCKTVLITILLLANHEENEWEWKGEKYVCKPGQLITSIDSLKKQCGTSITSQNVRGAISRLERLGFLTNVSTKTGRLITIVNWEKYQGDTIAVNNVANNVNNNVTNKAVTKRQQSSNKAVTPNKNDKNDKNVKNDKKKEIKPFSSLEKDDDHHLFEGTFEEWMAKQEREKNGAVSV